MYKSVHRLDQDGSMMGWDGSAPRHPLGHPRAGPSTDAPSARFCPRLASLWGNLACLATTNDFKLIYPIRDGDQPLLNKHPFTAKKKNI